jgi:hypothetical protein
MAFPAAYPRRRRRDQPDATDDVSPEEADPDSRADDGERVEAAGYAVARSSASRASPSGPSSDELSPTRKPPSASVAPHAFGAGGGAAGGGGPAIVARGAVRRRGRVGVARARARGVSRGGILSALLEGERGSVRIEAGGDVHGEGRGEAQEVALAARAERALVHGTAGEDEVGARPVLGGLEARSLARLLHRRLQVLVHEPGGLEHVLLHPVRGLAREPSVRARPSAGDDRREKRRDDRAARARAASGRATPRHRARSDDGGHRGSRDAADRARGGGPAESGARERTGDDDGIVTHGERFERASAAS